MKMKQFYADFNQHYADTVADEAARELARQIDKEIILDLKWQHMVKTHIGWHQVELKWEKGKDTNYFWNEACAWAMEQFGLPGERYVTHPSEDCMIFLFREEKDAILMTLKWL